ncbi:MAG: single-stranded DNA-binding protein [Candidatus Poribacteria bacterium]|nr:single-stranded DNA-binding protein [Candidatus Poribacteria bacterium]
MASYNKVILMGNLTRDPELKYLPSGTAMTKFGLAVNRVYTDRQSGEKKEDVCFVDITAWGREAEVCNEFLSKGRPVFLEGRLNFNSWETDDGQRRSKLDVVAERVQFLGSRQDGGEAGATDGQSSPSASAPSSSDEPPITDDDIPF